MHAQKVGNVIINIYMLVVLGFELNNWSLYWWCILPFLATPPSERVKELLDAGDDEDEEHASHDIFCEMEELRAVGDDGDVEWKETARWVHK